MLSNSFQILKFMKCPVDKGKFHKLPTFTLVCFANETVHILPNVR